MRGNVLDLVVAVVMGVAFGALVTALVKDIITPFIAAIALGDLISWRSGARYAVEPADDDNREYFEANCAKSAL